MGNFTFQVPSLGSKYVDYRVPILGDSFNWSWVRPMSQVKYIAIHHTAGPDTQTPDDIARYHVNTNGWGGVGYHFIITKEGTVYYVGDLTTARAHVLNFNDSAVGVCLVGSFIDGKEPTLAQILSAHEVCAQMLFRTPELSGIDGWEDVIGHKRFKPTRCPGDTWDSWRAKLILANSQPSPQPSPTPQPTPQPQPNQQRQLQITELFRIVLGREPDQSGLQFFLNGNQSIDEIRKAMVESAEHRGLLDKAKNFKQLRDMTDQALSYSGQLHGKLEEMARVGQ